MDSIALVLAVYLAVKILTPRLWVLDVFYIALVLYLLFNAVAVIFAVPFLLGIVMLSRGKFTTDAGTASALAATGVFFMAQDPSYLKAVGFALATLSPAVLLPTLGDRGSLEGLFRYLVISTIANAFVVTGLALRPVYGDLGNFLILLAIATELGAVPMFLWLVDVYGRSSPAGLVALASLPKLGAGFALVNMTPQAPHVVWYALGALSMLVGNLGALTSQDLRKVFAYSTVAHAGYALFAYPLNPNVALLLIYADALGKMGLFYHLDRGSPQWSAIALAVHQIGIPPMLGFWPKLYLLIYAAASLGLAAAVYILANIVMSVPYYFRVMATLPGGTASFPKSVSLAVVALGVSAPLWLLYLS